MSTLAIYTSKHIEIYVVVSDLNITSFKWLYAADTWHGKTYADGHIVTQSRHKSWLTSHAITRTHGDTSSGQVEKLQPSWAEKFGS